GEGQDRGDPAGEGFGDAVHRALRAAPPAGVLAHGVQAVLGDIQVQRAQVDAAEVGEQLDDRREVVAAIGGGDLLLHAVGTVHNPAVQRDHALAVQRKEVAGRV